MAGQPYHTITYHTIIAKDLYFESTALRFKASYYRIQLEIIRYLVLLTFLVRLLFK